jgi:flavine halogenase
MPRFPRHSTSVLTHSQDTAPEEREAVLQKVEGIDAKTKEKGKFEAAFTEEEEEELVLKSIRAKQMLRREDILHIDNSSADTIDGFAPNMKRGSLGLVKAIPTATVKENVKEEQT